MNNREEYQSKSNREARARELRKQGAVVHKSSMRNQIMHPQYIKDYQGTYQTGFGNTDYRTMFSVVYEVSWQFPEPTII